MVKCGKLKKLDQPTSWCSNVMVTEEVLPNDSTKVCLDPGQTLNKAIIILCYQIPTVQEILPRLARKKHRTFTGLFDPSCVYWWTSLLTTPRGRYCWLPLRYGVSCTPEEFRLPVRIHEALEGPQDVYCIAQDILIMGQDDTVEEANRNHDHNVLALMNCAWDKNLKFNP